VFQTVEEASAHPHFRSRPNEVPKALNAPLRVMEIEGVDFNKCCGTHLRTTAELQIVSLTRTEKGRGNTRIFFYTGSRAIMAMQRFVSPIPYYRFNSTVDYCLSLITVWYNNNDN
jgi:Ser-tRNA(Ala) deacylase AlaX